MTGALLLWSLIALSRASLSLLLASRLRFSCDIRARPFFLTSPTSPLSEKQDSTGDVGDDNAGELGADRPRLLCVAMRKVVCGSSSTSNADLTASWAVCISSVSKCVWSSDRDRWTAGGLKIGLDDLNVAARGAEDQGEYPTGLCSDMGELQPNSASSIEESSSSSESTFCSTSASLVEQLLLTLRRCQIDVEA